MGITFLGSRYDVTTGVFAYLTAEAGTTITTAGTWYTILGTFTNTPFENFSIAADKIMYAGPKQYMEVDWSCSMSGDSPITTAHVTVKINSTVYDAQQMGTRLTTANIPYAVSGTLVVELDTDDTVQLVTTADGNGDVITFQHFVTSIRPFFR